MSTKKKLFKIKANTVVLANSIMHVDSAFTSFASPWCFEETWDIEEVRSLKDLPKGWSEYSIPASAELLNSPDPWCDKHIGAILEELNIEEKSKTPEERIAELEREVESLKQQIKK